MDRPTVRIVRIVKQKLLQLQNKFLSVDTIVKAAIHLIITKKKVDYDPKFEMTFEDLAEKLDEINQDEKTKDDFEETIQKSILSQILTFEKRSNQKHKEFMKILRSYN